MSTYSSYVPNRGRKPYAYDPPSPIKSTQIFKIGDRVHVAECWKGTVTNIRISSSFPYEILFDGSGDKEWWEACSLKIALPEFKVGDRVHYINQPYVIGTVKQIDPNQSRRDGYTSSLICVNWDKDSSTDLLYRVDELNLVLQPKFKPGDRVRHSRQRKYIGTILAPEEASDKVSLRNKAKFSVVRWDQSLDSTSKGLLYSNEDLELYMEPNSSKAELKIGDKVSFINAPHFIADGGGKVKEIGGGGSIFVYWPTTKYTKWYNPEELVLYDEALKNHQDTEPDSSKTEFKIGDKVQYTGLKEYTGTVKHIDHQKQLATVIWTNCNGRTNSSTQIYLRNLVFLEKGNLASSTEQELPFKPGDRVRHVRAFVKQPGTVQKCYWKDSIGKVAVQILWDGKPVSSEWYAENIKLVETVPTDPSTSPQYKFEIGQRVDYSSSYTLNYTLGQITERNRSPSFKGGVYHNHYRVLWSYKGTVLNIWYNEAELIASYPSNIISETISTSNIINPEREMENIKMQQHKFTLFQCSVLLQPKYDAAGALVEDMKILLPPTPIAALSEDQARGLAWHSLDEADIKTDNLPRIEVTVTRMGGGF